MDPGETAGRIEKSLPIESATANQVRCALYARIEQGAEEVVDREVNAAARVAVRVGVAHNSIPLYNDGTDGVETFLNELTGLII